ncbi:hypothetical protein NKR23_g7305 [Pleurostoma richardsiae]|uniref:Xylanolytic transcriptional activator regulatory domain-containing protein n=1 Tax=Pleurostoma richardsiae TaxID=41990 RepID=A0AA38VN71_9PEZI|nr:hypothetical protein NKR23_g7305 [Pleurostoma richardsiae]
MHEFLRRAIAAELEAGDQPLHNLHLVEALVLSHVGMAYFGSPMASMVRRGLLIDAMNALSLLSPSLSDETMERTSENGADDPHTRSLELWWRHWLVEEAKRRLGYALWLIDCMALYHFGLEPLFSLESVQWDLPDDRLWTAQNAEEWLNRRNRCSRNPTLPAAVHKLFVDRQMKADLGEYSNLLLLHGVFRHIFRIRGDSKRTLYTWDPSAQKPSNDDIDDTDGSIPNPNQRDALTKWQSAAMDCVDVLHWSANSTIGQLSGAEHATVFHLQFSRVVLCSPYEKLRVIAEYLGSLTQGRQEGSRWMIEDAVKAENEVLQWAQQDEYKARLAALHCGSLFWHARRYSRRAFYEPLSVFLATLVLWAYSSYAPRVPLMLPDDLRDEDGSYGVSHPSFLHLDRPMDDEMVQFFVRFGRPCVMRAYVAGVGNIYGMKGSVRILREGRKLLDAISLAWGRTAEYSQLLEAVEKYTLECRMRDPAQESSDSAVSLTHCPPSPLDC